MKATVSTEWETDTDPDLSWLGEYSSTLQAGGIDRQERGDMGRGEYRYFNLGCGDPEYIEQDYRRMENYNGQRWWMEGCRVVVICGGISAEASLWGIESDCGDEYRTEIERDIRREAFQAWRDRIEGLRQTWNV